MKIRSAKSVDYPVIAEIQTESWKSTYTEVLPAAYLEQQLAGDLQQHWLRQEIRENDVVLLAQAGGDYLGFIAVWCRPQPFIDNLHVVPSKRSAGVGAALMQTTAECLIARDLHTAYLWVAEENQRAIRFYERLGGVKAERAMKDLFGNNVPTIRMVWDDVSVMLSSN